jgi:hypothetical protein
MKFQLFFVCFAMLSACSGAPADPLFDPSIPTSPPADGALSGNDSQVSDDPRVPRSDAAAGGDVGVDGGVPADSEVEADHGPDGAPDVAPRDVLSDPWPEDVTVERVRPPNCFLDQRGQSACCFARNQPPVDCTMQNHPHFCEDCPQ